MGLLSPSDSRGKERVGSSLAVEAWTRAKARPLVSARWGTECLFVKADVSVPEDCYHLVAAAPERFGSVNGLANSAGATDRGTLLDTCPERWERLFNTNARGPFLMMQGAVRHLVESGQPGSIVNIISMTAHGGQFHGAGPDWLTRVEAAQPMGQLVKPDQVAGLAAYLLSPESGVMTGALIDYDQRVSGAYPE